MTILKDDRLNTPWRKLSTAVYGPPRDGKTHGSMEIDITKAMDFIRKEKEKGNRITLTHLATCALGRALGYDVPEMNAYVKRGNLVPYDDVIIMLAVNMGGSGAEMTSIRIRQAHKKSVFDISAEVMKKVEKSRSGYHNKTMDMKNVLAAIPWPLRGWAFNLFRFLTNGLGLEFKSLGLTHDAFGSILLTNIGSHGLTTGTAALFPGSNLPAVIIMGKAEEKPVVREGKIVIRTILPVSGTFDHRIVDGYHGGKLASAIIRYLEKPEILAVRPK